MPPTPVKTPPRSGPADEGGEGRPPRIAVLDLARGLALLGMVLFHLDWDLAAFGYTTPPNASWAWTIFGESVAATFLLLSGIGLVLARARGRVAAARRLATIAAAAAGVTLGTAWFSPQEMITFGILHCILVTNLVALALIDAPLSLLLAASAGASIAPVLLTTGTTEGPPWWWLGVASTPPRTLDYRPVLPWLGVVLLGVALGRSLPLRSLPDVRRRGWRWIASAGRHSLPLYLVHQPILYGLVWLVTLVLPVAPETGFRPACEAECRAAGAGATGCRAACLCAEQKIVSPRSPAQQSPTDDDIAKACIGVQPAP